LEPVCQWILTRPGITDNSQGGIDYTPYIIEWVPNIADTTFTISVRSNNDATVEPNSGYAGALGAPGYGMQLYDSNGVLQCDAFWDGPLAPDGATDNCGTLCEGQGCANDPNCGGNCAQTPPNCGAITCSKDIVQPRINKGNGTPFATGSGLSEACTAGHWDVNNPGSQKMKIRLYSYCNGAACPTDGTWGAPFVEDSSAGKNPNSKSDNGSPGSSSKAGQIAGGFFGTLIGIMVLAGAGFLIWYFIIQKRKEEHKQQPSLEVSAPQTNPQYSAVPATSSPSVPPKPAQKKPVPTPQVAPKPQPQIAPKPQPQVAPKPQINRNPPVAAVNVQSSKAISRPLPSPAQGPQFAVGSKCMAKYSGDGKFYNAVVDQIKDNKYMVRYPDFNNDTEWLPITSLKPF